MLSVCACFPGGASGKGPLAIAGDVRDSGLIPGLERSPGGGHDNPLQYPFLENPTEEAGRLQSMGSQSWTHKVT